MKKGSLGSLLKKPLLKPLVMVDPNLVLIRVANGEGKGAVDAIGMAWFVPMLDCTTRNLLTTRGSMEAFFWPARMGQGKASIGTKVISTSPEQHLPAKHHPSTWLVNVIWSKYSTIDTAFSWKFPLHADTIQITLKNHMMKLDQVHLNYLQI